MFFLGWQRGPCSFSFFAFVGGGEAAEAGPAFVVRRRRISALSLRLRCAHAAHVRGKIGGDGLLAAAGRSWPHLDRAGPLFAYDVWMQYQVCLY